MTDELVSVYHRLAQGDIGLILSSFMFVHPLGRALHNQLGIHNDGAISGLSRLADVVHEGGGKIAFDIERTVGDRLALNLSDRNR